MSKQFTVTTTYDSDTRELKSVANLQGFVSGLPDQEVNKQQVNTLTLFEGSVIKPSDNTAISTSIQRILLAANAELAQWVAAAATADKSDVILGSDSDLDASKIFQDTIALGTVPDASNIFNEHIVNPPPSAP